MSIYISFHVTYNTTCVLSLYSDYNPNEMVFANAFPCLFPGGTGDFFDPERGPLKDCADSPVKTFKDWTLHLMKYNDGRFQNDQLFSLYAFNVNQRHSTNSSGNHFFYNDLWLGRSQPSIEDLKDQIRSGDYTFISKLRYFSQQIRGCDGYWRKKTNELMSWIDFHVSRGHGPPTHFMTLTAAENWWPDLRRIFASLERKSVVKPVRPTKKPKRSIPGLGTLNNDSTENNAEAASPKKSRSDRLDDCEFEAMSQAARRYPLYVNEYFMKRAKTFMDGYARDVLDIEYYWGRVEFAPGRGQIHLHILCIAKNRAYLDDFYRAESEEQKVQVVQDYAERMLDMTADVKLDESRAKFTNGIGTSSRGEKRKKPGGVTSTNSSPLGIRFAESSDQVKDHISLVHDSMLHDCNNYCLGPENSKQPKCRKCRFGFGTEANPNQGDTPGMERSSSARLEKDHRGVEHFIMPRMNSVRIVQHSRALVQAWRANADVQLLIYRSDPSMPDIGEIEAVSRYCVAYAGKRYQTTKAEIDTIQNLILG